MQNDITAIYYTANAIPKRFEKIIQDNLLKSLEDTPLISVSQKAIGFGTHNIVVGDIGRSHINIYRQALLGVKRANTRYIALCEDDILYSPDHFTHRSSPGVFAYNMSVWSIYTWTNPPLFSYKDRRVLHSLICERDLFIEAMEERFAKYPDDSKVDLGLWSEPGKYERQLGVTERQTEKFFTDIANVAFSHETALAYNNLGTRKKLGDLRVTGLPYWGLAEDVVKYYV